MRVPQNSRVIGVSATVLLAVSAGVFVWAFVLDTAGTGRVTDDSQQVSSAASIDPEALHVTGYRGWTTVEQATEVSPVIAEVEIGSAETVRWNTETGDAPDDPDTSPALINHAYTPIQARVIQVFKGDDVPLDIRLKQFPEDWEMASRVGDPGDRQIVFMFPFAERGSGETIWVVNEAWNIDGDQAINDFDLTIRNVGDLEADIAAAVAAN